MAEQPLCEDNHSGTCSEEGYFPQHNQMTVMNQSYGVQQSPVSPHFYQDPRESPVTPGQDFSAMWDASKAAGWPSNHGKNAPDLQGEAMEMSDSSNSRSYPFIVLAHANSEGSSNQPGNVLPRLDSFTQAFSSQSLHILQGSARNKGPNHVGQQHTPGMMTSSPGSAPTEGALRQLLFHKTQLDQANMPRQTTGPQQRYQQIDHQLMSSYEQTTAKHTQDPQQHHQLLHYGYQQQQHQHQHQQQQQQQQRAAHLEHMQKVTQQQQNLQYYLQQQSRQQAQITAHSLSLQQFQQQQQHQPHQPLQHQQGAYYAQSTQSTPHSAEQTMQSPPFLPNYSQNCKVQQQPFIESDQAHSTQQAQFYFQEQQKYRHLYHQNSHYLHPQQQQQQVQVQVQVQVQDEVLALPSEQYPSNSNCPLLSPGQQTPITQSPPSIQGLLDSRQNTMACQEHTVPMTTTSSPLSQGQVSEREVLPTIQLVSSKGGSQQHHHSPSAIWPQMCLPSFRGDPLSPDHSTVTKTAVTEKSDSTKKLLCSICRKEFKSLPALNGHMRSHGGFRALPAPKAKEEVTPLSQTDEPGPPIVMPVSVPVKLQPTPTKVPLTPHWPCLENDHVNLVEQSVQHAWPCPGSSQLFSSPLLIKTQKMAAGGGKGARLVKKYRHRPQPLVIPAPSSVPGGVVLFQSRLRSPASLGGAMPYTPPPMLSPARRGSGLFSSIKLGPLNPGVSTSPATQRVSIGKTGTVDGDVPDSGERCSDVEPRINIGPCFQAEIPDLQGPSQVEKDDHKACMLWTPLGDLNTPASQQKVDDLVKVACSSVLPGGGTNTEYALHCLFECGGNFMATLEKLLMLKPLRHKSNHLVDYHYAGSDKWTILEKKKLNQAIIIHNKDFFLIQKMVRTKTVAQCVEYYYTWKNRLRLGKRQRTCLTNLESESLEGWTEGKLQSEERQNDEKSVQYEHKVIRLPELSDPAANQIADLPNVTFVCEVPNCGSTFSSKQALSGHARIHSSPGPAPKAAVERSKIKSAPQSGQGSVKNSPAHSTTSGDTDPTVIFPCKECGKVFFKIKSRNAHMKTHRQPEDPQCWRPQKAPEQAHPEGAHAGKHVAKAPPLMPLMPLLQLPFDHRGLVKQLRPEEEEHAEEEDPLLTTPPMLQIETDEMSMSEEL